MRFRQLVGGALLVVGALRVLVAAAFMIAGHFFGGWRMWGVEFASAGAGSAIVLMAPAFAMIILITRMDWRLFAPWIFAIAVVGTGLLFFTRDGHLLPISNVGAIVLGAGACLAGLALVTSHLRIAAVVICVLGTFYDSLAVKDQLVAMLDPDWWDWWSALLAIELAAFVTGLIVALWPVRRRKAVVRPQAPPGTVNWREWLDYCLHRDGVKVRDHLALGAAIGLIVIPILVVVAFLLAGSFGDGAHLIIMAIMLPFVALLQRSVALYGRLMARNALAELEGDGSRRPILYLRAFQMDGTPAEIAAMREFRRCGPVIAIGRPDESLPHLGAARFYVSHGIWQDTVAALVQVAQLVVWATGVTPGLRWELEHIVENVPPEKFVLWAHPRMLGLSGGRLHQGWHDFLRAFGALFPRPLPENLGDASFICFNGSFAPILVSADTTAEAQDSAVRAVLRLKGLDDADAPSRRTAALMRKGLISLMLVIVGLCALADALNLATQRFAG